MSALPPKADIAERGFDVGFTPESGHDVRFVRSGSLSLLHEA
jgi:hypothetical protein